MITFGGPTKCTRGALEVLAWTMFFERADRAKVARGRVRKPRAVPRDVFLSLKRAAMRAAWEAVTNPDDQAPFFWIEGTLVIGPAYAVDAPAPLTFVYDNTPTPPAEAAA